MRQVGGLARNKSTVVDKEYGNCDIILEMRIDVVATISPFSFLTFVRPFVCPHPSDGLTMDRLSCTLLSRTSMEICRENPNLITMGL